MHFEEAKIHNMGVSQGLDFNLPGLNNMRHREQVALFSCASFTNMSILTL